jgi:flagella basal body P-ring formation protein FlgA
VYVPVDVVVTEAVLVSRKTLPRGHILTADDVVAENRNISRLVGGYIADPAELLGQRLKHQIMSGKIVTPSMLVADMVIKRGQTVTLLLQNNGLNISMSGKALMDGAINQRIRVENSVSRRIVEGLVRSPEHVEILVH